MPHPAPILTYARPKSRRWWQWAIIGVIAMIAVGVGWKYAPIARQRVSDWGNARAYGQRFDAVAKLAASGPWCWDGDVNRNANAAALIRTLRGYAPRKAGDSPEQVLFIRTGLTNGEQWLAVGYADMGQLASTTFYRDDWRNAPGYGGVTARIGPMKLVSLTPTDPAGDRFKLVVNVNGADNEFEWAKETASRRGAGAVPRANIEAYAAKPTTGWQVSGRTWQPTQTDVRVTQNRATPTTLPAMFGPPHTLAFTDDNRVAAISSTGMTLLDIGTGKFLFASQPFGDQLNNAMYLFSPDGSRLFVDDHHGSGVLFDPQTFRSRPLPPKSWDVDASRVYHDSKGVNVYNAGREVLLHIDWDSAKITFAERRRSTEGSPLAVGEKHFVEFGRDGGIRVLRRNDRSLAATLKRRPVEGLSIFSFSPNDRWLMAHDTRGFTLYDVAGDKALWDITSPGEVYFDATRAAWTPDGRYGVIGTKEAAYVWCTTPPYEVTRYAKPSGGYHCAALSPNGQHLIATGMRSEVYHWNDIGLPAAPTTQPAVP